CIERAVGYGMAITAYGQAPGPCSSGFDNELVANAFTHIPQQNAMERRERAHALMKQAGRRAGGRSVMVKSQHDPPRIAHALRAYCLKVIQRHGRRAIRSEGAIDAADYRITGMRVLSGLGGKDLLAHSLCGHENL